MDESRPRVATQQVSTQEVTVGAKAEKAITDRGEVGVPRDHVREDGCNEGRADDQAGGDRDRRPSEVANHLLGRC